MHKKLFLSANQCYMNVITQIYVYVLDHYYWGMLKRYLRFCQTLICDYDPTSFMMARSIWNKNILK